MVLENSCCAVVGQAVMAPPAGQCCEDSLVRLRQCHHAAIRLSENAIIEVTATLCKCRQGFALFFEFVLFLFFDLKIIQCCKQSSVVLSSTQSCNRVAHTHVSVTVCDCR